MNPIISCRVLVLLIASVIFNQGCTYFNLFYNAETAYNTAYNAQKNLIKNNPDTVLVLPADISTGYTRCIDKCNNVFEIAPKDVKWHDDALFLMGKALFYQGEYERAIRTMKKLQKEFPSSPFIPESFLYIGRAYLKNENLSEAEATLNMALATYPVLNKNQELNILLANLAMRREGRAQAIEMLLASYKSLPSGIEKMELALKIATLYKELKLYDKTIDFIKSAPKLKTATSLLYRMDYLLALCYSEESKFDKALSILGTMILFKPYVSHMAQMLYLKACIFDKNSKTEEAILLFTQITTTYSSSDAAGDSWFELGRIYQVKKNNPEKAKECYDKAATLCKDDYKKNLAQKRSKAIESILAMYKPKTSKDTIKADTITPLQYKIGEMYWLELDQPDSAFVHFCNMAKDTNYPAMTPKALYSAAWIARYALMDSVKAESLYTILVRKYPSNLFSKKAQEVQGKQVTIMTRLDSAAEAFSSAERIYYEEHKPEDAATAYINVYNTFPETDYGPKSLFAAAWIYDFDLDKNRTAKKLYDRLCDSCPKSSYCIDGAKQRLKIVADTLAALRARKKMEDKNGGSTILEADTVKKEPLAAKPDSLPATAKDSLSTQAVQTPQPPPGRYAQPPQPNPNSANTPEPPPVSPNIARYKQGWRPKADSTQNP